MTLIAKSVAILLLLTMLAVAGFVAANWAPDMPAAEVEAKWATPPSQFVQIAGQRVHYRDEGPRDDPSPLVFVHGFGSSLHAWEGWTARLRERRRVVSFDLAGFGLTGPALDSQYGLDRDVALLFGVMDALGISRAVVGGNSLGGAVAWRAALARPERVERLILVDAGGYGTPSTSRPLGLALTQWKPVRAVLENLMPRWLVREGWENISGDPARVTDAMVTRSVELTLRDGNRGALLDRVASPRGPSQAERITEITQPTLIVWGGRDRLIPVDDARRFAADIKGSTLVVFDDLGHAPEEEDAARTVAAVERWLGATAGDPASAVR